MDHLVNSSIVFIIQDNNPAMYIPDALKEWELFPEDFSVEPIIVIPPLSQIRFGRHYLFESFETRVKFEVVYPPDDLVSESSPVIVNTSNKFLDKMDAHLFESVGINFRFVLESQNLQRFGGNFSPDIQIMQIAYRLMYEPFILNVTLMSTGTGEPGSQQVIIDFNFDGDASGAGTRKERVSLIKSYLSRREKCLAKAREQLHEAHLE